MTLSTLFDRIAGKQRERQKARQADFRGLVFDIADGEVLMQTSSTTS
jgi:hypothetical protein